MIKNILINQLSLGNLKWFYLLIFIGLGSCLIAQDKVTKKALLVGVAAYPVSGGWATLNSQNDLNLIREALHSQGFMNENILTLSDDQATKKNIIEIINSKLIKEVKKGDIIYFHFSGHGQQKEDLNGDEIDGYDECIVPFDSPKKFVTNGYKGENLITDDELNMLFTDLRKRLSASGQLIVALDACHSGTGTRGGGVARGSSEPMASVDYIQKNLQNKLVKENNKLNENGALSSGLASMVAFFGSAQNQVNYEMTNDQGIQYGSLSYAISKNLVISKKEESYRGLFDKIKIEMASIAPMQQPQAEGDLDTEVLNGRALGATNYYKVISKSTDGEIIANCGFLQGINVGSVVGFFPRETRDIENNKPFVTGKIVKSLPSSSEVELDSLVDFNQIADSWIYVLEKAMGEIKVAVDVKLSDKVLAEKVKSKLFSYPFIIEDSKNARIYISDKKLFSGENYLFVSTLDNYTLDSFLIETMTSGSLIKITKLITKYLQGQFLRKLEISSEDIDLTFEIIPISKSGSDVDIDNLVALKADSAGLKTLKVGDQFQIYITNNGIKPAYINLIDIQPDNVINFLIPYGTQTAEEMRIIPGQKKLMPTQYGILKPLGNELFKLIASSRPLDLKSAYGTRGSINQSPFEKLFSETENVEFYNTRGSKPVSLGNMEISMYSVSFNISN